MPHAGPSKYQPLAAYLAALPPATTTVTLTVPEIAAILGAPLPRSALTAAFWANTRRSRAVRAHARAVASVGWQMDGSRWVAPGVRSVTFARADTTAQQDARSAR